MTLDDTSENSGDITSEDDEAVAEQEIAAIDNAFGIGSQPTPGNIADDEETAENSVAELGLSDAQYAQAAREFEEEEDTSPEVVRHATPKKKHGDGDPVAAVFLLDDRRRRAMVELLWTDGWNAVEAKSIDEVIELSRGVSPELVFVDANVDLEIGVTLPEQLRFQHDDRATRVIAVLDHVGLDHMARAVVNAFDDFIVDPDNRVEVLARATANLRASQALAESYRQRKDADTLLELNQTLASSLDLTLILHTVSRLIAGVIAFERCSIILIDPDHEEAIMVAASEDRTVRDLRIQMANYPEVQQCVHTREPVLIADAVSEPLLKNVRTTQQAVANLRTMALFPIVFEERVAGVLFLRSAHVSRELTEHEVRFCQTVASACAVAIRNARLFDSFRHQTERIDSMRENAERENSSLKKYADFFEYAADGMAIVNSDAQILYVNREGRRLLHADMDNLVGKNFLDYISVEDKKHWSKIVDVVRRGLFEQGFDLTTRRGGVTCSLNASGVGQDSGLIVLSYHDVSKTREMEIELRTTKEFLENLIDNSVDAIVAADMSGNIMLFNKGAERIFGFIASEVIGQLHVSELYPTGMAYQIMRELRDGRFGGVGRLEGTRREILAAGGLEVPVQMTASIIYENHEEVATVGVFADMREKLKMEERVRSAQDDIIRAEKAQVAVELAGMAAHELNQPLTSVLGYAEMLKHRVPDDDKRVRRPVDIIFSQAERMAEIVRKIGAITKYETKHYGASTMMVDLDASADARETGLNRRQITSNHLSTVANLASINYERGQPTDPRASIIRMDTVDVDPRRKDRRAPWTETSNAATHRSASSERTDPRGKDKRERTSPGVKLSDLREAYDKEQRESEQQSSGSTGESDEAVSRIIRNHTDDDG